MSRSDKRKVSRRGFIAGAALGATGAVIGREAASQTIHLGNLDDLPPNWWEDPDVGGGTTDTPTPGGTPAEESGTEGDTPPVPQETTVRVRRNAFTLDPDGPEIASLRRGIQVMRSRPATDPTGWFFQAAIHGFRQGEMPFGLPPQFAQLWGTCLHSAHPHFLSWHRMYLYFFERILRAAANDPSLTLPYWDYSSPGRSALPAAFLFPRDSSNPLFEANRSPQINNGLGVADQFRPGDHQLFFIVDTERALSTPFFSGGGGFNGNLENTPHNGVHGRVGGGMGAVPTAARDPIFWLHHCNVDRLWNRWAARWQRQPDDGAFLNTPYSFADEDRNVVQMTGREILDSASQLGYRYDDDPPPAAGMMVASLESASPRRLESAFSVAGAESMLLAETTLAESSGGVTLGGGTAAVRLEQGGSARVLESTILSDSDAPLPLAPAPSPEEFRTETTRPGAQPVLLQLEDIAFDEPSGLYTIYVNLPDGVAPDPRGPYYAGYFTPFAQANSGRPESFDITGLLNRQIEAGLFDGGEPVVRFFPVSTERRLEGTITPPVTIGRVRIVRP